MLFINSYKKILTDFLFFISLFIISISCDSTEPTDDLKPGRRDYIWTVDTLDTQMNRIQSIWGSSPDNVWAVGPGGLNPNERLWHFDGNNWQPYLQALSISPECIYGFAQNDVWMGGNDGKIFSFEGNNWNQSFKFVKQGTTAIGINNIWGIRSTEIYALGYGYNIPEPLPHSFLLKYNGMNWTEIYFSSKQEQFMRIRKINNQLFISGIILSQNIEPDTLLFYKIQNNIATEIYRNTTNQITFLSFSQLGNNTYFLIGQDLCEYVNGIFIKVISFSEPMYGYQAHGRSEKDIFLRMRDGLAHYNGDDIEYLYHFSNNYTTILNEPCIMEKDIFYVVHDNLNDLNLILRGHLKD